MVSFRYRFVFVLSFFKFVLVIGFGFVFYCRKFWVFWNHFLDEYFVEFKLLPRIVFIFLLFSYLLPRWYTIFLYWILRYVIFTNELLIKSHRTKIVIFLRINSYIFTHKRYKQNYIWIYTFIITNLQMSLQKFK